MGFSTNSSSLNGDVLENPWLFTPPCSSNLHSFPFLPSSPHFKKGWFKMLHHQYLAFSILFISRSLNKNKPRVVFYKKYISLYFSVILVRVVAVSLCQIFRINSLFLYHKEVGTVLIPCFSLSAFSEYQFNCFNHRGEKAALTSVLSTKHYTDLNNWSMLCEPSKVIISNSFQRAPQIEKIFMYRKHSNRIKST